MACNVFGDPITYSSLERMSEYVGKEKRSEDRAYVALQLKNVGAKGKNALEYLEKLNAQWGTEVSTMGLIYNATGNAIKLLKTHDWHGCIGASPFPIRIENGQWGVFLHVDTDLTGSEAAVVYRGENLRGVTTDWFLSWSNPPSYQLTTNKVFTKRDEHNPFVGANHSSGNDLWNSLSKLLHESSLCHSVNQYESQSAGSIGNGSTVICEAIFSIIN
ncbi:23 kDa jasmonate-induced protein-like [Cucurbita moschata]|uniref:23 kDa jasmonate-induced protein-like n=1 Tax=Cucurbita moschata TaxID=3662 RepID=A0A6J1HC46_CUCMO|nr:23 kDa jasmonate-induced protein-like [Cucurbita moschata]XP_022961401.1 23 kDa jasmonate-induced protein-like [Cucurbita moschata]